MENELSSSLSVSLFTQRLRWADCVPKWTGLTVIEWIENVLENIFKIINSQKSESECECEWPFTFCFLAEYNHLHTSTLDYKTTHIV